MFGYMFKQNINTDITYGGIFFLKKNIIYAFIKQNLYIYHWTHNIS